MLFGNELVVALRFGQSPRAALELGAEGDVVEEGPWIIELVVPVLF